MLREHKMFQSLHGMNTWTNPALTMAQSSQTYTQHSYYHSIIIFISIISCLSKLNFDLFYIYIPWNALKTEDLYQHKHKAYLMSPHGYRKKDKKNVTANKFILSFIFVNYKAIIKPRMKHAKNLFPKKKMNIISWITK